MASEGRGSVKISGSGSVGGGMYETVAISGSGKITGDIQADEITVSGSGRVEGNVKAGAFRVSGSFNSEGDIEAKEFRCSGSATVAGRVQADSFQSSGSVRVGGGLAGGEATVSGSAKIGGDVALESFRSRGAFDVDGLLKADRVEIALGGDSRAREIGGETLRVMAGNAHRARLEAESIEGDDVYLEGAAAKVVRGRRVVIGPGCLIGEAEYSEALTVDPQGEVGKRSYTGEGAAPAVGAGPVERPEGWARDHVGGMPGLRVDLLGREIRNPVLRVLAGLFGLVVAAVVMAGVIFLVLPAVGLVVSIVLGFVALVLLVVLVGLPVIVFGAIVAESVRGRRGRR